MGSAEVPLKLYSVVSVCAAARTAVRLAKVKRSRKIGSSATGREKTLQLGTRTLLELCVGSERNLTGEEEQQYSSKTRARQGWNCEFFRAYTWLPRSPRRSCIS